MNAAIYARYSSYNQTERSIEGQIDDCIKYAAANNIRIVEQYIDRARTGTTAETRPEFQRMIKDADKRQFDAILVYKLDRFARNRYDSAIYKVKLKKCLVRVVSVTENITDEPEGIILESMLEGMAEYFSANLSQNVKRGMRIARENGLFTGGHLPYGFALENKRVIINETEAEAVRYVFSEYASGTSLKSIINDLNTKGYKPRLGMKFTVNSFQAALRNKKYIGLYSIGDREFSNAYPRIIDNKTFTAVQSRIEKVKRAPAAEKAKVEYQLQGKLFCGMCGANMVGESGRGRSGATYNYYACAKRKKEHTCKKRNEKKDFIEWYIVEQTALYILTPERIDYIAERLSEQYEKEFSTDTIGKLERLIETTEREINDCIDLMLKNKNVAAVIENLNARVADLSEKKADMEIDLAKLKIASQYNITTDDFKRWLKSFKGGNPLDVDYRRRVIDTFVSTVYLYDDKIVIYYNIQDGRQVSFIEMCDDIEDIVNIEGEDECSNLTRAAPPNIAISEHLFFVNNGLFGIVIYRKGERD